MECKSDMSILNPWLAQTSLKTFINQHIVDDVSKIDLNELVKNYGSLYICTVNDIQSRDFMSEKYIDSEQYEYIKNRLIVKQVPFSLLNNKIVLNFLNILNEKDYPSHYLNNKGMKCYFETTNVLTISLLYVSNCGVDNFMKQYQGITSFHDIIQMFIVNNYLQKDTFSSQNKLVRLQMINNMNESNYWCISSNCKLNITMKFLSRGFTLSMNNRLENKEIKAILEKISVKSEEDNDYLSHIFKKQDYVDASNTIDKEGYKLYRINRDEDMILKEDFNNMLDSIINKQELYTLLSNMVASKDYCHLIVNNGYALEKLMDKELYNENNVDKRSLLQKYTPLFSYLWSYAWLTMYYEECIKKTRIEESDRFVFDLETASKLPYFPMSPDEPHKCPYLPIMVNNNVLLANENVLGVSNYILKNENLISGIVSPENFIERFNTFVSGSNNKQYFKDVNWNSIAVSGSIMAACLPKFNPLMLNFYRNNEIDYNAYFNEYYREADIDVMCLLPKFQFIDKVHELAIKIETNIRKYNNIDENDEVSYVKVNYVKTCAIFVNKEFIYKYILPNTNLKYTDVVLHLQETHIKKLFHPWYIKQKMIDNKLEMEASSADFFNQRYVSHFELCDEESIMIYLTKKWDNEKPSQPNIPKKNIQNNEEDLLEEETLNDENEIEDENSGETNKQEQKDKEQVQKDLEKEQGKNIDINDCLFKLNENLKFRISSKYLLHNLEVFRIRYNSFFSTAARFHLPIVRSYYNGHKTFLLPSCISACMTMMNIDYKYFAGAKDPIEIINKYRMRGFGTYLNGKEKIRMLEYSSLVSKWKKLYDNFNIKSNNSTKRVLGMKKISDTLFKPSMILNDANIEYQGSKYLSNEYTKFNINDAYGLIYDGEYNNITGVQQFIHRTTCINDSGYVLPLRKWLISGCYEFPIRPINNNDN